MSEKIDDIVVPTVQDIRDCDDIVSVDKERDHDSLTEGSASDDDEDEDDVKLNSNRSKKISTNLKRNKNMRANNGIDFSSPDILLKKSVKNAKSLACTGKNRQAINELIHAVALSRIVYGDGHCQLATAYVNLAEGYLDLLGYAAQAISHAETAKHIIGSIFHGTMRPDEDRRNVHDVNINIEYIIGRGQTMQKNFTQAESCFLRCDSMLADKSKTVVKITPASMEIKTAVALAKVSFMMEKYANAAVQYEKALNLLQSSYGKASAELIPIYQGLGMVELAKGHLSNTEHAISMYEKAHTISSGIYDPLSLPVAETARALAEAYTRIGGPAAETSAKSYLNECLATYLSHHGPHHKDTIHIRVELAKLMLRTDKTEEGISELKSSVAAIQELYGDYNEELSDTYLLMANVYLAQGNMKSALKFYQNCLEIEMMMNGVNHRRTRDIQVNVDKLLANPKLAAKHPKSKQDQLQKRPRFSSIVNRTK